MIDWLNSNANAVIAFSAVVTALATGALAVLTRTLAQENQKLRKAGEEPKVVAYLAAHPIGNNVINFVLANIGQGPALDVRFEIIYDDVDFKTHGVRLQNNPERTATSALPQGEKIIAWLGMNATLEAMARAVFKSWFVDFDPVRAKSEGREPFGMDAKTAALFPSRLVPSALGDIPEGWEEKRIGDVVETISKTYPLHTVDQVVFLNTGDIQNGRFLHANKSDVGPLPGQAKKSIQKCDILYSEIRPENKRFAFVHFDCPDYVVSTKLMVLRAKTEAQSLFAYFVLSDQSSVDFLQMMAESRSGTFPQITFDVLSRIGFIVPTDSKLIEAFTKQVLEPVYQKMISNDYETKRLEKTRDYLLPKLISGEIRIPDAEKMVGGAL